MPGAEAASFDRKCSAMPISSAATIAGSRPAAWSRVFSIPSMSCSSPNAVRIAGSCGRPQSTTWR